MFLSARGYSFFPPAIPKTISIWREMLWEGILHSQRDMRSGCVEFLSRLLRDCFIDASKSNSHQVIGVKEGNVSGGSGGTHVQAKTKTDWSMLNKIFLFDSVSFITCFFLLKSLKKMYLGCLTDDEQSRARANVPTDLATIKNLSMSASERSFRDLQVTSSLSASPLLESSFGFWPGGIQSRSSMSGKTTPTRSEKKENVNFHVKVIKIPDLDRQPRKYKVAQLLLSCWYNSVFGPYQVYMVWYYIVKTSFLIESSKPCRDLVLQDVKNYKNQFSLSSFKLDWTFCLPDPFLTPGPRPSVSPSWSNDWTCAW